MNRRIMVSKKPRIWLKKSARRSAGDEPEVGIGDSILDEWTFYPLVCCGEFGGAVGCGTGGWV